MRAARVEIVRSGSEAGGWFSRLRAPNGRIVWTTELYTRRQRAQDALYHLGKFAYWPQTRWPLALQTQRYGYIEVREVDERTKP